MQHTVCNILQVLKLGMGRADTRAARARHEDGQARHEPTKSPARHDDHKVGRGRAMNIILGKLARHDTSP